ncbi:MepB family protein [Chryseobacterium sp. S-02]|uniref:MepB family protein n=1 Tax=Chryseobacterium sp. S-02 TaxID=3404064 RepID=UPI003CF5CB71
MIKEIEIIHNTIFQKSGLHVSRIVTDSECEEYLGYNFTLNQLSIKFRKAKITPKKAGQFVTLWRRNTETKETEPFNIDDKFDFYIIAAESDKRFGFFFFPKNILSEMQIISASSKVGKRRFRVYPDWAIPTSKQAEKTQKLQAEFFINIFESNCLEKFSNILQTPT